MTTMTMIHDDKILAAIGGADAEWRARFEDSRLAIPGHADAAEAAAIALDSESDLLLGYVMGLYAVNARH